MGAKRNAGLGPIEDQVFNAYRWTWWMAYSRNGSQAQHISLDKHAVLQTLRKGIPGEWSYGDDSKVSYRLNKLVKFGKLMRDGGHYSNYRPSQSGDFDAWAKIEAEKLQLAKAVQQQKLQVAALEQILNDVIPGNKISVSIGYSSRGQDPNDTHMALSGPLPHFRLLTKLAKQKLDEEQAKVDEVTPWE